MERYGGTNLVPIMGFTHGTQIMLFEFHDFTCIVSYDWNCIFKREYYNVFVCTIQKKNPKDLKEVFKILYQKSFNEK